jgi:hypothetical protein
MWYCCFLFDGVGTGETIRSNLSPYFFDAGHKNSVEALQTYLAMKNDSGYIE